MDHHEILYCEGEKAEKLHIIYRGSFELQVKDFFKKNVMDKNEIGKERLHTVLKLEKGDIAGIESLKEDYFYQQTMKVNLFEKR